MEQVIGMGSGLILGLALGLVFLFLLGIALQWLWNTTLPEVLGVKQITVVQAVKIMLIASILFGGHRVVAVQQVEKPAQSAASPASSGS